MSETNVQQQRIARGLCPRDGNEAAPYYLCAECRYRDKVRRIANRFSEAGLAVKTRHGREYRYHRPPGLPGLAEVEKDRGSIYREAMPDDRRLNPRLRNIPVDVEAQLRLIFEREGKPLTEAEICAAWGRLRLREARLSAATDLAAIVRADRKRQRKYGPR